MALTDENGGNFNVSMPVQPMGGGYGYGGGYGGYPVAYPVMPYGGGFGGGFGDNLGGDWIILFLFAMMFGGGWGGMGGFGGGFGNMFEFPWLLTGQQGINANTNAGFNQAALQSAIGDLNNNVVSGFGDVQLGIAGVNQNICQSTGQIQNSLCQGFAGTTAAVTGAQNAITSQLYNNEIASLNRSFAEQVANTQAINGVSSQLSKCCCDQELATANLGALVQRENCADREALSNGIRDIITNQTANTQRILDTLCQDKIDAKNEKIVELQNQVNMQNLAASQAAQTAALVQDNNAQTAALIQRIAPYPQPSFLVGNPYYYNGNYGNGCGCGCGCNG